MASFHIKRDQVHWTWNNAHAPVVTVRSGDLITLEVANASGGQIQIDSTVQDVAHLDFTRVNPVSGPVFVESAEPGDALLVEVLGMEMDSWGWTANIPGFGLLAEEFSEPHLRISRVGTDYAEILSGIFIPVCPFIGTIGVAPAQSGDHPLVPPSVQGGNMDMRDVTTGCKLWLPVAVPGALLSVGDTHAAQGDGEVAGTAIETSSMVTLRVYLQKNVRLGTPRLESDSRTRRQGGAWVTTGIGPDLLQAARHATREMIDWLGQWTGLSRLDAYLLLSVAGDLAISEVVDAPNWVVSMRLGKDIFERSGSS
ncbi:MAG: acetamidase [Sulfobacillus acidophilus]|uniref:Acetamidase n=1 Tax=Sulfobacillus acidophilus TaxID=53633 RepID=A0A2T2WL57_9FIRM|nr:MAG: acetamidase [Sulfobacillus acidophilus]